MQKNNSGIPAPLKKGSTIGVVAPSGQIQRSDDFEKGIRILHELGFQTKFPRDLWPGLDYLADSDSRRIEEFNSMWADTEVDAVMTARGGYGCLRITDQIVCGRRLDKQKLFIGFSDATLLHNWLNTQYNIVTLHGPVVTSLPRLSKESLQKFNSILTTGVVDWLYDGSVEILRGEGKFKGISSGGNLSTIISILGTSMEPSWCGKIVFLEDTSEPTYRIDRMLTQLKLCGKLDDAEAIILGDFSHGLGLDIIGRMRHHESIWKRTLELTGEETTVWGNFPIGHGSVNYSIPLGLEIILDNSKSTLIYGY